MKSYDEFLERKSHLAGRRGFEPTHLPDFLFPFQRHLCEWSIRRGCSALFVDCGLGKTAMQLVFAENCLRHSNRPALIITPLAVSRQTCQEGEKFGIEARQSRDGKHRGGIVVTNYEKLHLFDPSDFSALVCDESSAIKDFEGKRQSIITHFAKKVPYRLLSTATAAPNDYIELGTSSEALGELGRMDMLGRFFKNDENSLHPIFWGARWRLKGHAERDFWRWVCSWARAMRRPSDLGFSDEGFNLPPLVINQHVVKNDIPRDGFLWEMPAETLQEQREERRLTLHKRCAKVLDLVGDTGKPAVVWCHLNTEADLLEKMIPGSRQVSGAHSDEEKEEIFDDFSAGRLRVLITKPKIGAWGLNWQHCAHTTFFPSHSFEQWYQGTRRFWRFGQKNPVVVDIVTSEGESAVMDNFRRKADQADQMFQVLVKEMGNALRLQEPSAGSLKPEMPSWL
jgi:hypothetical protein